MASSKHRLLFLLFPPLHLWVDVCGAAIPIDRFLDRGVTEAIWRANQDPDGVLMKFADLVLGYFVQPDVVAADRTELLRYCVHDQAQLVRVPALHRADVEFAHSPLDDTHGQVPRSPLSGRLAHLPRGP